MTVKVKDAILMLQAMDPEALLVCQKDSEGNGYSPLSGIDPDALYEPESSYHGQVYSKSWTASDAGMTQSEWVKFKKEAYPCVVLFPVN